MSKLAAADAQVDASALLRGIDSVTVVRLYSDSSPRFATPFGAMENPPWSLAQQLGCSPAEYVYPAPGGDSPQSLVTRACRFVTSQGIQLHGGIGTTEEYAVGHHYRAMLVYDKRFGDAEFHLDRSAGLNHH